MTEEQNNWILRNSSGDEIDTKQIPQSIAQAIYYQVHKKTQKIGKGYAEGKVITKDDIFHLCQSTHELLRVMPVIGLSLEIIIEFENNESIKFTSAEKFYQHDFNKNPSSTKNIEIIVHTSIRIPEHDEYQPYKINISAENTAIINNNSLSRLFDEVFGTVPITASIEYVQLSTAMQFKSLIDDWYNCLENVNSDILLSFISKHKEVTRTISEPTGILFGIVAAIGVNTSITSYQQNTESFSIIISLAIGVTVYKLIKYFGRGIYTLGTTYKKLTIVELSGKDKSLKRKSKNNSIEYYVNAIKATSALATGIIGAILSETIVNLIIRIVSS